MGQCTLVFKCGEEKYHVGETKTRELRSQIRKHEMEPKKLMTKLENKQSAINASKNSVKENRKRAVSLQKGGLFAKR